MHRRRELHHQAEGQGVRGQLGTATARRQREGRPSASGAQHTTHSARLDTQPSKLAFSFRQDHPGHCLLVRAPSAHYTTPHTTPHTTQCISHWLRGNTRMHPWPAPKACYNGERPDPRTPGWPYRSNREDLVKTVVPHHTPHTHTHTPRYTPTTTLHPHRAPIAAPHYLQPDTEPGMWFHGGALARRTSFLTRAPPVTF